jgi:ribokinase
MPVKKVRIVVVGSLIYDCVAWADRLPKVGEAVIGTKTGFFCGGKGANQAVQAAKLGAEVYFIGKLGADREGEILLNNLKQNGVHTDYVKVDSQYKTGIACIHVDKNGNNTIILSSDSNEHITPEEILVAEEIFKDTDIVLTQLEINLPVVYSTLRLAKKYGKTTVLNTAPPQKITADYYQYADYITPNETEAEYFTNINRKDYDIAAWCPKVCREFRKLGVKAIIITLGKMGAYFSDGSHEDFFPTFDVKPADTTGAGDAFNGAFSVKIGEGAELVKALNYANAAGALAASRFGAQSSLATKEEVENLVQNGRYLKI